MIRRGTGILALALTAGVMTACTGMIGGEDDRNGAGNGVGVGPNGGGVGPNALDCSSSSIKPGDAPVRRMTREQYNATVRDLLGDDSAPANGFVADGAFGPFDSNKEAPVTSLIATQYMNAAEKLAQAATANIDAFAPCAAGGNDAQCAADTIASFGKKAYRRPLTGSESTRLLGLFTARRAQSGETFQSAMQLVLQVMLQSPQFVNHMEIGDLSRAKDGAAPLTSYEIASRLSYSIWGTMPDQTLFVAADQGKLDTVEDVEAQARRMLDDPRSHDGIMNFYSEWLGLAKVLTTNKSADTYPQFNPALRAAMAEETKQFVNSILWNGDAHLETLLDAPFTFVNGPLAQLYGVQGVTGDTFTRVDLDPKQRRGIFGEASFLAANSHEAQTSPVHRGKFIRERILCQQMPSPPANANTSPPSADATTTTRERFAQHSKDPVCAGCHKLMDPIGLAFEEFDGVGAFRATENNLPVDSSGELVGTDVDGTFVGLTGLVDKLVQSDQVRKCVATQWFRYALERPDATDDTCPIQAVQTDFAKSGYNLKELIILVAKSDSFRFRKVDTNAGACQ